MSEIGLMSPPPIARRGDWQQFNRMRGAGWTMAHFQATDERGYYLSGTLCGYNPHRGLKSPSMVQVRRPDASAPRCSRCETRHG